MACVVLACAVDYCELHKGVPEGESGDVTRLLRAWSAGDRGVEERLFAIVLPDLRRIANYYLRREPAGQSLQTSGLVNEAYLRLVNARDREWADRQHFFALAARMMRRLIIDHARGRRRGEAMSIAGMEELLRGREIQLEQAIAIDQLLDELEALHPDLACVVELRFFLGMTEQETAEALGITLRTQQRRFADARRWLYERVEARACSAKPNATNA